MRDDLLDAELVVGIGNPGLDYAEGANPDDPAVFGSVVDVAVDAEGHVHVLDEHTQEVRVFDLLGRFVRKFGGYGDGPSELRHAIGIELLGDERVLVATRGLRVKVFAPTDRGWTAHESVEVPVGPRAVCSMRDGRVFFNGFGRDSNTLVHQLPLAEADSVSHAFAEGYRDDSWLVQMTLSEGSLACADGRDLVVLGHRHMPTLRAFDAREGTLAWSSRLASFSGAPVYQGVNERGQDYVRRDRPVRWDALGAVHPVAEDHLLVQVGRGNLIQREVAVESYLLDAETGIGAFLGERLPRAAPFDGGYVALFEDPYPRIEVRAFRDSPFAMRVSRLGETAQR